MPTATVRYILFVQTASRPLLLQDIIPSFYGFYNRVVLNSKTVNSRLWPTSKYSSIAGKNLKTFHSSNKKSNDKNSNENNKPRKRNKYRTLSVIIGLTHVTSVVSVFYERKDIKPREFLE